MPLVTITAQGKKSREFKQGVFASVHDALVSIGVSKDDRFLRFIELDESSFEYHPTFPDAASPRTSDFVLIEILLGSGRSVKLKRQLVEQIARGLREHGLDPEHAMVCLQDVPWENWSPAGGRLPHA